MQNRATLLSVFVLFIVLLQGCVSGFEPNVVHSKTVNFDISGEGEHYFTFAHGKFNGKLMFSTFVEADTRKVHFSDDFFAESSMKKSDGIDTRLASGTFSGVGYNESSSSIFFFIYGNEQQCKTSYLAYENSLSMNWDSSILDGLLLWSMQHGNEQFFLLKEPDTHKNKICSLEYYLFLKGGGSQPFYNSKCVYFDVKQGSLFRDEDRSFLFANDVFENGFRIFNKFIPLEGGEAVFFRDETYDPPTFLIGVKDKCKIPIVDGVPLLYTDLSTDGDMKPDEVVGIATDTFASVFFDKFSERLYFAGPSGVYYTEECNKNMTKITGESRFTSSTANDYAWTFMSSGNLVVCGTSDTTGKSSTCLEIQIENCKEKTENCLNNSNCAVDLDSGNGACSTRRKCNQTSRKCINSYLDVNLPEPQENTKESFSLKFDLGSNTFDDNGFSCLVDSTFSSKAKITGTELTCDVSNIHTSSEVVQKHSVIIKVFNQDVTKEITFGTVNCSNIKTCKDIDLYSSKCGWCFKTGKGIPLSDKESCKGYFNDTSDLCPNSLYVSPGTITKSAKQPLTVTMLWFFDYVESKHDLHCVFIDNESNPTDPKSLKIINKATNVDVNAFHKYTITCPSPDDTGDAKSLNMSLCISDKGKQCDPSAFLFDKSKMVRLDVGYCDGIYDKDNCTSSANGEKGKCHWLVSSDKSSVCCYKDKKKDGFSESSSFPKYVPYEGRAIDIFVNEGTVTQTVSFDFEKADPLKGLVFSCYLEGENVTYTAKTPIVSGKTVNCSYDLSIDNSAEGNFYLVMKDGSNTGKNWVDGYVPVGGPIPYTLSRCLGSDNFATCVSKKGCGMSYASKERPTCGPYTEETMDYTTKVKIEIPVRNTHYMDRKQKSVLVHFSFFPNATNIGRKFTCTLRKRKSNDGDASVTTTPKILSRTTILCEFDNFGSLTESELKLTVTEDTPGYGVYFGTPSVDIVLVDCTDDSAKTCNSCLGNLTTGCSWSRAAGKCLSTGMRDSYSADSFGQCYTFIKSDVSVGVPGDKIELSGPTFIDPSVVTSDYTFLKLYNVSDNSQLKNTVVFISTPNTQLSVRGGQFSVGAGNEQVVAEVDADVAGGGSSLSFKVPSIGAGSYSICPRFNGVDYMDSCAGFEVQKKTLPLWLIIVIAVGAALILIAILIPIIIKVRRYTLEHSNFKFDVNNKPDFTPYMFSSGLSPNESDLVDMSEDEWTRFRALMRSPVVAKAIASTIDASEMEKVGKALMYVNASEASAQNIMKVLFKVHVDSCLTKELLFRENCLATYSFQAYCMLIGLEYLWATIARFEHELHHDLVSQKGAAAAGVEMDAVSAASGPSNLSADAELDPTRASAGSDSQANVYLLSARVRSLIVALLDSTDSMPPALRSAASCVRTVVEEKFPDATRRAIGGTIILRFINPAITLPERYCLLTTPDRKKTIAPDADLRRQYTMASKVLQCLANGVLMGKKEQYMSAMNSFILKNQEPLDEWLERISQPISFQETAITVPQDVLDASCQRLHRFFVINKQKVCPAIEDPQIRAAIEALI